MFTGEYLQKLDSKGRVVVPQKFRSNLGEIFYITKSLDGCLSIYEKNNWESFQKKLEALPYTDQRARDLKRFTIGSCQELEIDKQGRILIPLTLRNVAKMKTDIVFVGVSDHIEVWDKKSFDSNCSFEDSDKLSKEMEGLYKDLGMNV